MSFTEELELCLKIVDAEEQRACYYIRDADNRKKYIDCFNESLIAQKIEFRLRKADGLSKYIEGFEEGKEDFAKELKDFWRLYSRVLSHSLPVILSIYENYLMA